MSISVVTRELLVRYLDTWAPGNLHAAHGATYLHASAAEVDGDTAEAALRVFAEFSDRLRGRRLSLLFVTARPEQLQARLYEVQRELGTPAELAVHVSGGPVGAVLKAVGAPSGPLFSTVDDVDLAPLAEGKPAEVFAVGRSRAELQGAGFALTAGVVLVQNQEELPIAFGTRSAKSLEAFKNEMWALDEYAGVRYRDPQDPQGQLMDIALEPNPGALRRELLDLLRQRSMSVTELKRYALTDTVYRASDAVKVITALLHAGAVTRSPAAGRLGGDVMIRATGE